MRKKSKSKNFTGMIKAATSLQENVSMVEMHVDENQMHDQSLNVSAISREFLQEYGNIPSKVTVKKLIGKERRSRSRKRSGSRGSLSHAINHGMSLSMQRFQQINGKMI